MVRSILVLIFSCLFFSCKKEKEDNLLPISEIISFTPEQGNEGDEVTITGTNFGYDYATTFIKFNGIPAKIKSLNGTYLTAIVPIGVSTGKINVAVNGKSANSAKEFIVLPGKWVEKETFDDPGINEVCVFTIGKKAYFVGGYLSSSNTYPSDFWEYDTLTNLWTKKANFPAAGRGSAIALTIGNKGYFGLGWNNNSGDFLNTPEYKDFWEYDPFIDQWTRKKDFPGFSRLSAIAFGFATVGFVGLGSAYETVYFEGGYEKTLIPHSEFWKYEPASDEWTKQSDFPGEATWGASGFSNSDMGYVLFGYFSKQKFWQYNPSINKWDPMEEFPGKPRTGGIAFAMSNRIYAGTGSEIRKDGVTMGPLSDFWEFDLLKNTWKQKAGVPGGKRWGAVGFSIGNKGFVRMGYGDHGNTMNGFWQFTP